MSRADAWMPLYIGDYLADTMHLEAREHGAYLLLLMHYWRNGPLPDNNRALAGIARVDRKTWESDTGPIVREFFAARDGKLHQKRMDEEREKVTKLSQTRREAGSKRTPKGGGGTGNRAANGHGEGEQTGSNRDANADAIATANARANDPDLQTHARTVPQSQSQSSVPDGTAAGAADDPPDARDLLWKQGVPILQALTGKPRDGCARVLGKMLRDMQDDCPRVLLVLQQARETRPADPLSWLTAATQPGRRENAAEVRMRERDEAMLRLAEGGDGRTIDHEPSFEWGRLQ